MLMYLMLDMMDVKWCIELKSKLWTTERAVGVAVKTVAECAELNWPDSDVG